MLSFRACLKFRAIFEGQKYREGYVFYEVCFALPRKAPQGNDVGGEKGARDLRNEAKKGTWKCCATKKSDITIRSVTPQMEWKWLYGPVRRK